MKYTLENFNNADSNTEFVFVCQKCGKEFVRTKSEIKRNGGIPKYCSRECSMGNRHRGFISVTCSECGKTKDIPVAEYEKKIKKNPNANFFCDKSCAAKYNNKKYVKRQKEESICPLCGKHKEKSAKICKECLNKEYEKNRERELGYYIGYDNKVKYTARALSKVRQDAKRVMKQNENADKVCACCKDHKFDEILEVHHIKGIMKFNPHTKISEVNSLKNLIWLCPNCHTMIEKGLINL